MPPAGGGDKVGGSGGPSKHHQVERRAAGGAKEGQSLGVESESGKSKDPIMSKGRIERLEFRCEDSQRIIKEIENLKSELDEDLQQLGYCEQNEKLRAELAVKVKEMHCLMKRIEELEVKNDFLRKRTEELEIINDGLPQRYEELQAKNDDLTKQNKELQARIDGLTKGNEELQAKNDDLHKNIMEILDTKRKDLLPFLSDEGTPADVCWTLGRESESRKRKAAVVPTETDYSMGNEEDFNESNGDSYRISKETEDLRSQLALKKKELKCYQKNKKLRVELALKVQDTECIRKENEVLKAQNKDLQKNMADEADCCSEGEKSKSSDELGLESSNNDESRSSGTADDNNNDEDGSDSGESTRTESLTFNTQFSMNKLTKLICRLTEPQKDLIRQCEFASILDLKCSTMPHKQLIVWLATHYDEKTQCIKIPGTRAFKLDALTVHWILGIPHGGDKIKSKASQAVKFLIANDTTPGPLAPKIEDLIAMITPELVGDRFVRIFMLVVLSIFLCPTSSLRASCHYYEGIRSVKKIKSYDWCDAVMGSLKSGLSKFQMYVGKGNICGKATLSGCIFVLFTAYFDYLGKEMNIVPQTIPRIGAWTNEFVHQYMQLDPKFKKMEIKTVDCTVFAKTLLNRRSRRGSCFDASNESPSCAANVAGPSQHKPSEKIKKRTKSPSHTLLHENVQIDRGSVQRVISKCTNSGFRVFSGEELHPEVDKYICSVAGTECSKEVLVHLRNLCQSFFKDSFREYILSVEPVIVTQSCALVRSYMSGLQQSSTQKVSTSPSKDIEVEASSSANTHGSQHMAIHTEKTVGGSSNGKD